MIQKLAAVTACLTGAAVSLSAAQATYVDVEGLLARASARVVEYFARAQSIMCLEKVSLQRLTLGFSAEGPARFVESELRLSWTPTAEDPTPKEAHTLRQVMKVNGSAPRKGDHNNCTTPEQQDSEVQPLSILLPDQRAEHLFGYGGRDKVDGREAIVITYREIKKPKVESELLEDSEDCISFDLEGGMHGRIWLDPVTHDVLRLDRSLVGLIEIPVPRKAVRNGGLPYWTMERWDTSIRFKPVKFEEPTETLILPVSATTLQVTRGAGTPRLRTSTQYLSYRRFLTGGRVVPQ
jgi:hypothetical protein